MATGTKEVVTTGTSSRVVVGTVIKTTGIITKGHGITNKVPGVDNNSNNNKAHGVDNRVITGTTSGVTTETNNRVTGTKVAMALAVMAQEVTVREAMVVTEHTVKALLEIALQTPQGEVLVAAAVSNNSPAVIVVVMAAVAMLMETVVAAATPIRNRSRIIFFCYCYVSDLVT